MEVPRYTYINITINIIVTIVIGVKIFIIIMIILPGVDKNCYIHPTKFPGPDSLLEGQIQAVRHHLIAIVVVNIIIIIILPGVDDYCCIQPK